MGVGEINDSGTALWVWEKRRMVVGALELGGGDHLQRCRVLNQSLSQSVMLKMMQNEMPSSSTCQTHRSVMGNN